MTDKSKKRRKAFAKAHNVSLRTATNRIAAKTAEVRARTSGEIQSVQELPPGVESYRALKHVYKTGEGEPPRIGPMPPDMRNSGATTTSGGLSWVHIDGTTFANTSWRLSNDPEGAKFRITYENPVTRQVIMDAVHRAICPLRVETSADGGMSWRFHPDPSPQWDWEAALSLASTLLHSPTHHWNVARVVSRDNKELVRYAREDRVDSSEVIVFDRTGRRMLGIAHYVPTGLPNGPSNPREALVMGNPDLALRDGDQYILVEVTGRARVVVVERGDGGAKLVRPGEARFTSIRVIYASDDRDEHGMPRTYANYRVIPARTQPRPDTCTFTVVPFTDEAMEIITPAHTFYALRGWGGLFEWLGSQHPHLTRLVSIAEVS